MNGPLETNFLNCFMFWIRKFLGLALYTALNPDEWATGKPILVVSLFIGPRLLYYM